MLQASVYGEGYDEPGFGPKRQAADKKRPNPEEEAALKDALAETDYAVRPPFSSHSLPRQSANVCSMTSTSLSPTQPSCLC